VVCSVIVQLAVVQVWHDDPLPYAKRFFMFLTTEYLAASVDMYPWRDGRAFVSVAALLLEGVALLRCTNRLCREDPTLSNTLVGAAILSGLFVALLLFYEAFATASADGRGVIVGVLEGHWSSPAIPSIDTVGPYLMLIVFLAVAMAAASSERWVWGTAAAVCFIALWLNKTRAAVVAALVTIVGGAVWRMATRVRWLSSTPALLVSGALAIVVGVCVVVYNPLHVLSEGGLFSMHVRRLFAETGLRMAASAPLAGVGVGQYALRYPEFASAELLRYYARNNAHNYVLWIWAELGFAGLVSFVWLLGAALLRGWLHVRDARSDYWAQGVFAGVVAFIITWSIGQPLDVPQVAFTFWILLGVVASLSSPAAASRTGSPLLAAALTAAAIAVVASVPIRAHRAIDEIDLARVSYGFYNSGTSEDGRAFKWVGPNVTFFLRAPVRAIDLPMAALLPATPHGVSVDILVDKRPADRLTLANREWRTVRINAPASADRYWRVDLRLNPIDIPPATPDEERRIALGDLQAHSW